MVDLTVELLVGLVVEADFVVVDTAVGLLVAAVLVDSAVGLRAAADLVFGLFLVPVDC